MKHFVTYVLGLCIVVVTNSFAQVSINDECATATVISTLPYSTTQNTRLATPNVNDPVNSCNDPGTGLGKTVWFKYTAAMDTSVRISMVGSTPAADYDIMFGVYTGTCGNLTEVSCADDSIDGIIRQPSLFLKVKAGTEYYFLVGEWNGGGTSGGTPTGGDLVLKVYYTLTPPPIIVQLPKGPKAGSVASGALVDMSTFGNTPDGAIVGKPFVVNNRELDEEQNEMPLIKRSKQTIKPLGAIGSNYVEDQSVQAFAVSRPVIEKSFQGIPMTNSIPPDPIMAVGPNHIIVMVNSSFRIFDKSGNIIKTVTAQAFYQSVAPNTGPNDPQIVYDHYAKRFVMVWMTSPSPRVNPTDHRHLIAVSADSNAMGTWYMWNSSAIAMGDSATPGWGDYPALGYDSVAVYLTSNQFPLAGGNFLYAKLRLFPKTSLYQNATGALTFKDWWDFHDPSTNVTIYTLRPPTAYNGHAKAFFINTPRSSLSNYVTVLTLSDPVGSNPVFEANIIPTVQFRYPPNGNQLGGSGTLLLEYGNAQFRANVVYRDSALYATQIIGSGTGNLYSAVRYLKINPYKNTTIQDYALGSTGYWHSYPMLMVNKNHDVVITYSRSGTGEYVGAFMTGRKENDPAGLSASIPIREGAGNYIVDYGSGRNRWGDYMGAGLDPTDDISIWTHTEYASAKGAWATWVAKAKVGAQPGAIFSIDHSSIDFGTKNVGVPSDTIPVTIYNDGLDALTITSISNPSANFKVFNKPTTPFTIPSQGSLTLGTLFQPTVGGGFKDSVVFVTNDPNKPKFALKFTAYGFIINIAQMGTLYATSGSSDGGNLYNVNSGNGTATLIEATGVTQLSSLRVHPTTKELIGYDFAGSATGGAFYRISSTGSNFQLLSNVAVPNLKGLAFKDDSTVYMGGFAGIMYTVNIKTGVATQFGSNGLRVGGLAVHPKNGSLWMSLRATSGEVDAIYKVNTTTGAATKVGLAGTGVGVTDIVFDKNGKLYGLTGPSSTAINTLVVIDTTTGAASLLGSLGKANIMAIALNPDAVASVNDPTYGKMPTQFSLEQNYPNPFNPMTSIRFTVPTTSFVVLKVYDAIGREVSTLANGTRQPGTYTEYFDASRFASGMYYYKISAGTFSEIKKMLFIK